MAQNEFKVGDYVRRKKDGAVGKAVCVETYVVCVEQNRLVAEIESRKDFELIDRKIAFLTELQALLRRYNAEIYACQTDFEEVKLYLTTNKEEVEYGNANDCEVTVNADNIMDFNKK